MSNQARRIAVQVALQPDYKGPLDGIFGPRTDAAYTALRTAQDAPPAPVPSVPSTLFADIYHGDPWPPAVDLPAIIHKVTQGLRPPDPAFKTRWADCVARGILVGGYHFTSGEPADAQARHFLDTLKAAAPSADALRRFLPCLDFEHTDPAGRDMTLAEAERWISIVEADPAIGCKVCVYGSDLLIQALQDNPTAFAGNPLWPARYRDTPPELPHGRSWAIWQFTDQGQPFADMDEFNGSVELLRTIWPHLPA